MGFCDTRQAERAQLAEQLQIGTGLDAGTGLTMMLGGLPDFRAVQLCVKDQSQYMLLDCMLL